MEILPLAVVKDKEQAAAVDSGQYDALIMYASARNADVLEVLARPGKWNLMFVRHKSGPIYYMYVGVHGHFLRKTRDPINQPRLDVHDIVVDRYDDLLCGCGPFTACAIQCKSVSCPSVGGGWGADGSQSPVWRNSASGLMSRRSATTTSRAGSNGASGRVIPETVPRLGRRLSLRQGVKLETTRDFVENSFILTEVFRDYMTNSKRTPSLFAVA